jgi:cytochrome c553
MPGEARRGGAVRVARRAALVWAATALWAIAAAAQQPSERTLQLCVKCHGERGQSTMTDVPALAGQPKVFVENQLVLVREGLRDIAVMREAVKNLSDEEIVALARYYAAQPPRSPQGTPNPERLRAGAELSRRGLCASCHLPGYTGQQQVPRLAGQHEAYLLAAMKQFRDAPGPGRDTIMASTLRGLSDGELESLAHYMAHSRP